MNDADRELMDRLVAIERDRLGDMRSSAEAPTIFHTQLPEDLSFDVAAENWNVYRHEVGRLLAEGHEGRWVLIKERTIIGIWDTEAEVKAIAAQRYLLQPVLIHQVCLEEKVVRGPYRLYQCRS
jgi:hypothetical protein